MLSRIKGGVRFKEDLFLHTSLRIGGKADVFVIPLDVDDIRNALLFAKKEQLPVVVIGGGNNLLVKDRGVRGVVLSLGGCFTRIEFNGDEVIAGAGLRLSELIREAALRNLGGIECLAGIPATVGGALAMNAGTPDGAIGDFVLTMFFVNPDGTIGEFKPAGTGFTYRTFNFLSGAILIGCRLQLRRRPLSKIQKDIKGRLKQKKRAQPLDMASAGCVWKNPPGDFADRLIKSAGLMGKRIKGAQIFVKHANFIVNCSDASAADVLALMNVTREQVNKQFGIMLDQKIRIVGE